MSTERFRPWMIAGLGLTVANPALAAAGNEGGIGVWLILFLALGALVIAFQAIPALVMFGSIIKALFAPMVRHARPPERVGKPTRG